MKLIIDINKEDYEYIRENKGMHYTMTTGICEAIFEGTPLPKGHGNLYDERDLKKIGNVYFREVITKDSNLEFHFSELIIKATPIIEADKGE